MNEYKITVWLDEDRLVRGVMWTSADGYDGGFRDIPRAGETLPEVLAQVASEINPTQI